MKFKWVIYAISLVTITALGYMETRQESILAQDTIFSESNTGVGWWRSEYSKNYADSLNIIGGPGCRACKKQETAVKKLIQAGYDIRFTDREDYTGDSEIGGLPTLIFEDGDTEVLVLKGYTEPRVIKRILREPDA